MLRPMVHSLVDTLPPYTLSLGHVHALIFLVGMAVALVLLFGPRSRTLPPGPRRLPFLGNLFDIPTEQEWLTFSKWGQRWGEVL